ncbi:hypothetical protein PHYSODRAFT_299789 [Phytophthora sojae]|uniref:Retrovirus-related Pol polyprotein from transposon TNT 1-94-like beta-barrel domain-containing protein n=1 Tax=Phytophthora sojae (strain P6497) TaxID=1094619 RepID=G4Z9F7_PHYSP|nr:hypothetical protein PHYSODRAFT_299789 [Phytophthora sojae]EGZ22589.1 hypothetical protein PHYSODRAFT_299789 [Phytophthora sojae]|eukprot:XP_009525306.1 hypothetical protein PHYSODRAFT_299789 [Phytophthora sojae]
MQRRKQARWKIDKTLSPDLSKTVEEEATPFGVLERLRKMFVGATKLSLVHQLRAVMVMKYDKAESTELEFDKLVELLESSYLEVKRQDQLQGRGSEAKSHTKVRKRSDGDRAMVSKADNDSRSSSESAMMSIDARCYGAKTDPNEWILDSAATRRMTYSKDSLVNYCPISAAVEVGGKHELHVMGIGGKRVALKTDHGTRQVWLRNVYFVPSIQFNLFSVRMQVAMRGADYLAVHFDHPAFATAIDENNGIARQAKKNRALARQRKKELQEQRSAGDSLGESIDDNEAIAHLYNFVLPMENSDESTAAKNVPGEDATRSSMHQGVEAQTDTMTDASQHIRDGGEVDRDSFETPRPISVDSRNRVDPRQEKHRQGASVLSNPSAEG